MAIVRKHGKADVFITMTANPGWPEVQALLLPHQTAIMRPDLVARVFHQKLDTLMHLLLKCHVLGRVVGHLMTVEWQKRGLPHAHILLVFDSTSRLETDEHYDAVVCAEIPPLGHPLHELVIEKMIHSCSNHCLDSEGKCRRGYPMPLRSQTNSEGNTYPRYRRRPIQNALGGYKHVLPIGRYVCDGFSVMLCWCLRESNFSFVVCQSW